MERRDLSIEAHDPIRTGRVAVLTDAVSAGFAFPLWWKYYAGLFGAQNLFVIVYDGERDAFASFDVGEIICVEQGFADALRVELVGREVRRLLETYETVIRVDVDEFLVTDPDRHGSLGAHLATWSGDYITARGFDLIHRQGEAEIDLSKSILSQRRGAFALTAMNKTCITRVPLKWGLGFHYCDRPPELGVIYLFHLKRIDRELQRQLCMQNMARAKPGSGEYEYSSQELGYFEDFLNARSERPFDDGAESLTREAFNALFHSKIALNPKSGIYEGPYILEENNVLIPERFSKIF